MEFIDLRTQQAHIRDEIDTNIRAVLDHGKYIMGPEVAELEQRLADFVGVKHCIGVSSGTDALLIALMALGIAPGDEVITTPFTFIATAEVISLIGAKPVFVDIDTETYNIDPLKIESAITTRTRAILPVSLYGQCADFEAINAIAERHGLPVIEDGAQSFGATFQGRRSCGLSTIGCTSFFPSKPLGCYGDGGACFTSDDSLAKAMREIRVHGQDRRYHYPRVGINGRLDTLQAAVLLAKMNIFPREIELRQQVGDTYTRLIRENSSHVFPPCIDERSTSVYAQYTVLVENREQVQGALAAEGIPTAIHYPVPLHKQPTFKYVVSELPVAESLAEKVISLPMHPYFMQPDQERIVSALAKAG
jgi:UDP-2-acetamido-2-deoxy-ribo-hexuluronate aminotransferase